MHYRLYPQITSMLIVCTTLFLFSCAQPNYDYSQNGEAQSYQHTFTSVGYAPIATQKGSTFDLKMLNAIKVSKLEAYKELAEQIYGVLLSSENEVSGSRLQDDLIESRVQGIVRGARVLKSYHEGDVYITELELDMKTLAFLRAPEFNKKKIQAVDVEKQVYY